jgi:hypothetical protein
MSCITIIRAPGISSWVVRCMVAQNVHIPYKNSKKSSLNAGRHRENKINTYKINIIVIMGVAPKFNKNRRST